MVSSPAHQPMTSTENQERDASIYSDLVYDNDDILSQRGSNKIIC